LAPASSSAIARHRLGGVDLEAAQFEQIRDRCGCLASSTRMQRARSDGSDQAAPAGRWAASHTPASRSVAAGSGTRSGFLGALRRRSRRRASMMRLQIASRVPAAARCAST
jgi:hypothetical protein